MKAHLSYLAVGLIVGAAAFGTTRPSGEKGARPRQSRLAAGYHHICALLDDGSVRCWGDNGVGQLGDGTFVSKSSPVPVSNLGPAISIASGSFTSCAITSAGT